MVVVLSLAAVAILIPPIGAAAVGAAGTTGTGVAAGGTATLAVTGAATAETVSVGLTLAGPAGWVILGAAAAPELEEEEPLSWDCWKAVLRDTSPEPSKGKFLKDVAADSRVNNVTIASNTKSDEIFPQIILENIWNEKFFVDYVMLSNDQRAAHAVQME